MKAFLNWSGGKDSAFCLYHLQQAGWQTDALVTTVSEVHGRVSMHGVRQELLHQQTASLQLPLHLISLPENTGMSLYEARISQSNRQLREQGFDTVISGDIFLEDLKAYRESLYSKDGLSTLFPLWKMDTRKLVTEFIAAGFRAVIVCVDGRRLDQSFCGRLIDASFLQDLPDGVDPCGENGEYHSFVFDGPIFTRPVPFEKGEIVCRTYETPKADDCFTTPQPATPFYFCDLLPLHQ